MITHSRWGSFAVCNMKILVIVKGSCLNEMYVVGVDWNHLFKAILKRTQKNMLKYRAQLFKANDVIS